MSARSFRSVFMVASCAGAALGCYLVSLNVASERAALEEVERKIVLAQRDIRLIQTEIGTRGRLAQLERWNARVLALSAPSADQFVDTGFALAQLVRPDPVRTIDAPIVLASAPAPQPQHAPLEEGERRVGGAGAKSAADLLHAASLKVGELSRTEKSAADTKVGDKPVKAATQSAARTDKAAKAASKPAAAKPAAPKPVKIAKADPLAPLPEGSGMSATARTPGQAR